MLTFWISMVEKKKKKKTLISTQNIVKAYMKI